MPTNTNVTPSITTNANVAQKLVVYVMPDLGTARHKFMVMRRTQKNAKGRYITAEEFEKFGLFWPNTLVGSRNDLALLIGRAILAEAGV